MAGQNTSTQQTLNGQKFKELEEFVKSFQTEINTIETKLNGCKEVRVTVISLVMLFFRARKMSKSNVTIEWEN